MRCQLCRRRIWRLWARHWPVHTLCAEVFVRRAQGLPESVAEVSPERLKVSGVLSELFAAVQVGQIEAIDGYLRAAEVVTAALNAEYERGRRSHA